MPRNEEQNQQIRDERREQILLAARKVFAKRGMAATKISDIAKEAGLSHGLIYHYFKSKEEIFSTLVTLATQSSSLVVEYAKKQQGTPLQQLEWMTKMILQSIEKEGAYLFLIMIQAFTSDAVPEDVKQAIGGDFNMSALEATIPLIEAGQEIGEISKDDPLKLAVCYYSLIQGLAISKIQWKDCPLPDEEMIMKIFKQI